MDIAIPAFTQTPACGYVVTVTSTTVPAWMSYSAAGAEGSLYSVYTINVSLDQTTVPLTFSGSAN